jgi:hypothetical protein
LNPKVKENNEVQANGGIDNINARYNIKIERYIIGISYMKELGDMPNWVTVCS